MIKNTFKILRRIGSPLEVTGYTSDNFGIHKVERWTVTHLRTGCGVTVPEGFEKLKSAKDFVSRMEQAIFPIPWEKVTMENARKNAQKTKEIYTLTKKIHNETLSSYWR